MKIIMGADPLGYELKESIKKYLLSKNFEVVDISPTNDNDYFDVGFEVGQRISNKEFDRGFIFCGTGMGVNIVANKFTGAYSALCESIETARLSRIINNSNILAMGGIIITPYLAKQMVDVFLETPFSKGFSEANPEFLQKGLQNVQKIEKNINKINNN